MLLGCVYLRTKTLEIEILGGLNKVLPICCLFGLFICLGAIAVPFSGNFVAIFMMLNGLISSEVEFLLLNFSIVVCAVGWFVVSVCILTMFHKIFYGETMSKFKTDKHELVYPKRGITKSEIIVLSFVVCSILFLGLFPNSVLEIFESATEVIVDFLKV